MALAKKRVGRAPETSPEIVVGGAGTLGLARVVATAAGEATIEIAGRKRAASIDASVDLAVLETAERTGERVLVELDGERAVIVGALRTRATPGVDRGSSFDIQADSIRMEASRVSVSAKEELTLSSSAARVVLRAAGEIESFAERIVSRASGVHKIVGRMLRLN
jgi:hypothetical protein